MSRYHVKIVFGIIKTLHAKLNHSRRTAILSLLMQNLIPANAHVLDICCGDGDIDEQIVNKRQDITLVGIDVMKRNKAKIPVTVFNGQYIPYPDNTFDCVLLIDVLHHTENPDMLIQEAKRVSRQDIIIKDHYAKTKLDHFILRFMDWVSNKPHGVILAYNYLSPAIWKEKWDTYGLKIHTHIPKLHLYPYPFTIFFDGSKQFIVKLKKSI